MKNYPKKVTMTVAFEVIHVSPEPISRADALRKAEELGGRFPTQIEALVISEQYPETIGTPVPFYTRDTREFYTWSREEYKGFGYCYPAIRAIGAYEQDTTYTKERASDMHAVIVKSL